MTILGASRDSQSAMESGGHGLFTSAAYDGLDGGAADHFGWMHCGVALRFCRKTFSELGPSVPSTNRTRLS